MFVRLVPDGFQVSRLTHAMHEEIVRLVISSRPNTKLDPALPRRIEEAIDLHVELLALSVRQTLL